MREGLELVSRRRACGWSFCALMLLSTATSYVFLGRSITVVDSSWKMHSSANITGDGPGDSAESTWCLLNSDFSGNNRDSSLTLAKVFPSVIGWILVGEGSAGFAFLIRFSDSTSHSGGNFFSKNGIVYCFAGNFRILYVLRQLTPLCLSCWDFLPVQVVDADSLVWLDNATSYVSYLSTLHMSRLSMLMPDAPLLCWRVSRWKGYYQWCRSCSH